MRNIKVGVAIALVAACLAPLGAKDRRQDGVISGSAAGEAKQPYTKYVIRGRDTQSNLIAQTTTLDADAKFALNGLTAGTYMIELVKGAQPNGQGGKIVCAAGPFTLQDADSQVTDLMIKKGANVQCNRPMAAYYLLGAAAAAGVTAGVAAGGDAPAPPAAGPTVNPTAVSGAQ
jgi:hypothetical protein